MGKDVKWRGDVGKRGHKKGGSGKGNKERKGKEGEETDEGNRIDGGENRIGRNGWRAKRWSGRRRRE